MYQTCAGALVWLRRGGSGWNPSNISKGACAFSTEQPLKFSTHAVQERLLVRMVEEQSVSARIPGWTKQFGTRFAGDVCTLVHRSSERGRTRYLDGSCHKGLVVFSKFRGTLFLGISSFLVALIAFIATNSGHAHSLSFCFQPLHEVYFSR